MFPSRGSNAFGQSGYGQNLGPSYSGSSVGGHSSILGGSQEGEVGGYRGLASAAARYGGQYGSLYGSAGLSGGQQPSVPNAKSSGLSALDGRGAYSSTLQDSPKFASTDYLSAPSHSYSHRADQLYTEKMPDYPTIERRQYGEQRPSSYMGRDVPSEPTGLYGDSVSFRHQHQPDLYDRVEQSIMQRQEQLLKAQSAALDAGLRQPDYLTAKVASGRHPTQDLLSYADPRSLSMLSSSSYSGQHAQSILGAAPRRSVDDLMYPPTSSNPGYGVSLPPGRDYGTKTLHVSSPDPEYPGGHPRIDERKDDRAAYLREFEIREDERRRERLRERERDRDREKERERERLRERERERDRERLRILERREKERAIEKDRERKRALEVKREKSLPRALRDHRGSSSTREGRPLRRESPRRETSHRRHSPAKEKRREYVCKVYSFNLIDVQRDYLSIDKRYPRLFVSPEFTKVIVNWPRENLKLSIHTPVSFEHDFVEGDHSTQSKELSSKLLSEDLVVAGEDRTVWNAKLLLMSGISKSALEDLSSEKVSDERMTHICSILRFGILKKDHTFMTIGGPWSAMDGGDPSQDNSSLVRTALRHAKDTINLDLQRCQNWNRFLEIHYDRFDKDGRFSHKEVTVLFVPDLSDCLPSLDAWRAQWLAHKRRVAEREKQLSLKKEKSKEKEGRQKDKGKDKPNDAEKGKLERKKDATSSGQVTADVKDKVEKKKESTSSGQVTTDVKEKTEKKKEPASSGLVTADVKEKTEKKKESASSGQVTVDVKEKAGNQSKVDLLEQKNGGDVSKDGNEKLEGGVSTEKKDQKEATGSAKTMKRKIIKRIIKQKVTNKMSGEAISASNQVDKAKESPGDTKPETSTQPEDSPADPVAVKTFARKKPVTKGVAGNTDHQADGVSPLEENKEKQVEGTENNMGEPKVNSDVSATASAQNATAKATVKRKVIKRVPKKKVAVTQASEENGNKEKEDIVDETNGTKAETEKAGKGAILEEKQDAADSIKSPVKDTVEAKKDEKVSNPASAPDKNKKGTKKVNPGSKVNKKGKPKNDKETKDSKDDSKSNSSKELKEKRKSEDAPPRHPGFILQTKWNKDSKLRSLSLSLDSLLEYTDKDIDESTFELSLFAEILYEMLQYQMGSRLVTFLQKLRVQFVAKRNKRKRQKEEASEKEKERSPAKRMKANELPVKNESTSSGVNVVKEDDKKAKVEDEGTGNDVGEPKMEEPMGEDNIGEETEEDPEEDPEECEEMEEISQQASEENKEEKEEVQKSEENAAPQEAGNEKVGGDENAKDEVMTEAAEAKPAGEEHLLEPKDEKVNAGKKEHVVDKELLQAFRFFDRHRVGYIRVEDLRLILHSLGRCTSHRDVKELVQSALLESNTGRDDRILYNKLVTMSGL